VHHESRLPTPSTEHLSLGLVRCTRASTVSRCRKRNAETRRNPARRFQNDLSISFGADRPGKSLPKASQIIASAVKSPSSRIRKLGASSIRILSLPDDGGRLVAATPRRPTPTTRQRWHKDHRLCGLHRRTSTLCLFPDHHLLLPASATRASIGALPSPFV